MNKRQELAVAFLIALVLIVCMAVVTALSNLLDLLPKPWDFIANGVMFLVLVTAGIYGFISFISDNKTDKERGSHGED